jgi:hypothetical protein
MQMQIQTSHLQQRNTHRKNSLKVKSIKRLELKVKTAKDEAD